MPIEHCIQWGDSIKVDNNQHVQKVVDLWFRTCSLTQLSIGFMNRIENINIQMDPSERR